MNTVPIVLSIDLPIEPSAIEQKNSPDGRKDWKQGKSVDQLLAKTGRSVSHPKLDLNHTVTSDSERKETRWPLRTSLFKTTTCAGYLALVRSSGCWHQVCLS